MIIKLAITKYFTDFKYGKRSNYDMDYRKALKIFEFDENKRRAISEGNFDIDDLTYMIDKAWKKLSFPSHPDRGGDELQFKILNSAHQRLIKFLREYHTRSYEDAYYYSRSSGLMGL